MWEVARRRGHVGLGPTVSGPWHTLADMNAVTGWLLWSHRMASPYGGMTGKAFAAAARARGVPLSETEVSRTENGESDIAITALGKYERMLDMPPGTLSAPLRSAARLAPHAPGSGRLATLRTVPKSQEARHQIVDDFYVRYVDGERFTASDWLMMVDAITYRDNSLLPDALAAQWIRALLDEAMRAVNSAYYLRVEALSAIAECDRYAMHVLAAVRELTAAKGVSGATDAWGVVSDIRNPEVFDTLIAELPSVPDHRLMQYALALSPPADRRSFTAAQDRAIATDLERRLASWSLGSYEPIATLAAELPKAIGEPILRRIDNVHPLARLTGRRTDRDVTREVSIYTQAAMATTWPDHPHGSVLPELLRLSLSSERAALRYHATTLIYCSPFSPALCDTAADLCTSDERPVTRQLATYLISRLATPDNDERLRLLIKQANGRGLVTNVITAMAHAGILTDQDDLQPYLSNDDYRDIGVYAAGITHHPDLYSRAADGDAATWWREKRGGILE